MIHLSFTLLRHACYMQGESIYQSDTSVWISCNAKPLSLSLQLNEDEKSLFRMHSHWGHLLLPISFRNVHYLWQHSCIHCWSVHEELMDEHLNHFITRAYHSRFWQDNYSKSLRDSLQLIWIANKGMIHFCFFTAKLQLTLHSLSTKTSWLDQVTWVTFLCEKLGYISSLTAHKCLSLFTFIFRLDTPLLLLQIRQCFNNCEVHSSSFVLRWFKMWYMSLQCHHFYLHHLEY